MTPQEFETLVRQDRVPAVCYLYGDEHFLLDRIVSRMLEKALDPALKDFNLNVFFGGEAKGVDIVDAAQTLPMFADRRVVLVKRSEGLSAAASEALLPYLGKPSAGTCLIFTGTRIDQRRKFFQEIKKHGTLVEFKRLYDNKLPSFVQEEARTRGKIFDSAAAELLALLTGNELQELSAQIEKLSVYAGERSRITVDDVKTVASSGKISDIFELAGHLCLKDLHNSLKCLDTLLLYGEEVPKMVGALAHHFRKVWRVREMLDLKMGKAEIIRITKINAYFMDETIRQARNFSRESLRRIFEELNRTDIASKSGGQPQTLMHALVMYVCTKC